MSRESPTLAEQFGPGAADYTPTELEESALGVLEALDEARTNAETVLSPIFAAIVAHRLPVGLVLDLRRSRVSQGTMPATSEAVRIERHSGIDLNVSNPHLTRIRICARPLLKNGALGKHCIEFFEPVLGYDYMTSLFVETQKNERDRLVELIAALPEHQS